MVKFCIFTTQRSGSSWLGTMLNSHPQIKECGELFFRSRKPKLTDPNFQSFFEFQQEHLSEFRPQLVFEYLKKLDQYTNEYDAIGFKLMYGQIIRRPEVLIKLFTDKYKIIHLIRDNYLDVILSTQLAREYRLFHSQVEVEVGKVTLEPSWLLKSLHKQDLKVKAAKLLLTALPNPVLEITYNQLYQNTDGTLAEILSFLQIPERNQEFVLESKLRKINKKNHREVIANFSDVKAALATTKFADFLNTAD